MAVDNPEDKNSQRQVREMFKEMVGWPVDEGVDYMIGETFYYPKKAWHLNIKYQGFCCGAAPIHIREVAETMGRRPPASRYSENMPKHFMYGDAETLHHHVTAYGDKA